ncbi:hydroxymethylpyrimidine pyrophosphatase-like HAD family hydrolase [Actinomadura coerulea]|uniref:Hydroxymethylpyrimidine pyrophosphatase-like HAD family hydrolase n=1 Tax=Actinomadura coerulea TaxID=46159 RepID=A0A7X0G4X1_9ACTN|nr:hydroxymethylpyrimidine pyrophosphatase-like HAD family hydrolase [Actinomadura coerulea]
MTSSPPPPAHPAARPRLIATDLDGTLLGDGGAVSARNAAALRRAADAGAGVVLVTGRSQHRLGKVYSQLGARYLAICANGGVVYDPAGERVLACRPMPPAHVRRVCALLRERVPEVVFAAHVECGGRVLHEPGWPRNRKAADAPPPTVLPDVTGGPVVKLQARAPGREPESFVALVAATVGDLVEVTRQGYLGLVEMSRRGVTKGSALAAVAGELAIPAADVLVFGDMPNDVPMMLWAGRSVAVANAHAEVRAAATDVTLANVEDGVGVYLERLLDGRA